MKLKRFFVYWFPVIAYMLLIFYLSSLPNESFKYLNEGFGLDDSIEHFLEYSLLSILFLRLLINYHKAKFLAVGLSTLYGITDEIHQLFVPTRVFSFSDIFFDLLGSLVAVLICLILLRIIKRRKKQSFIK